MAAELPPYEVQRKAPTAIRPTFFALGWFWVQRLFRFQLFAWKRAELFLYAVQN